MNHNRHFSEWLADSDPDYHTAQDLYYKLENKEELMRSFGVGGGILESREEDLEIIIVPGYKTRTIQVIFYGVFENIP